MFASVRWGFFALFGASAVAQGTLYQLTMSLSNPAPVPGQPFIITWTGGEANEAVYIVLNNYFPNLPNQDIIYGGMDILCKSSFLSSRISTDTPQRTPLTMVLGPIMCLSMLKRDAIPSVSVIIR
jgi:hypothetical protein